MSRSSTLRRRSVSFSTRLNETGWTRLGEEDGGRFSPLNLYKRLSFLRLRFSHQPPSTTPSFPFFSSRPLRQPILSSRTHQHTPSFEQPHSFFIDPYFQPLILHTTTTFLNSTPATMRGSSSFYVLALFASATSTFAAPIGPVGGDVVSSSSLLRLSSSRFDS